MKTSLIALICLMLVGAAGYWLQSTGRIAMPVPVGTVAGGTAKQDAGPRQGGGGRAALPVEVADARQSRISDDISAIGTLVSEKSVDIAPETSGRVIEIGFSDGQPVKQGDLLFRLDGELVAAQIADAEAKLALAESTFNRNEALRKTRTVAQSVYDQSVTELALARSALNLARVQQDKLSVRAPFDGTLGFSAVSTGAYVTAGTTLVHLEKIERLKASFSVPELDFTRLRIGQNVTVTADAVPGETFAAQITALDPLVDVNGRAIKVLASLDNTALKLRPGMLIRVTIQGPSRDAVTVPEAAIVPRGNDTIVFVAEENTAMEAKVLTGKRADGAVEIIEGLRPGAKVVVAGNTRLSNGAPIQVVSPQAAN